MPLVERDLNKNEQTLFPSVNRLRKSDLKTYEKKLDTNKSGKRRPKRTLKSIPEISPLRQCETWLDLYDDERSEEEKNKENEVFLIEFKNNRESKKRFYVKDKKEADENTVAKKVVEEHIAKRPKLSTSSITISKKTNDKTISTVKPQPLPLLKLESPKKTKNIGSSQESETSFELFKPNWVSTRPRHAAIEKNNVFDEEIETTKENNKENVYDIDYVPETKSKKSLIKPVKAKKKETFKVSKKKNAKKLNKGLVEVEMAAAKEKWEKECEDISNYKLVVEHVDHDY